MLSKARAFLLLLIAPLLQGCPGLLSPLSGPGRCTHGQCWRNGPRGMGLVLGDVPVGGAGGQARGVGLFDWVVVSSVSDPTYSVLRRPSFVSGLPFPFFTLSTRMKESIFIY